MPKGAQIDLEIYELLGERESFAADAALGEHLKGWQFAYGLYTKRAWGKGPRRLRTARQGEA